MRPRATRDREQLRLLCAYPLPAMRFISLDLKSNRPRHFHDREGAAARKIVAFAPNLDLVARMEPIARSFARLAQCGTTRCVACNPDCTPNRIKRFGVPSGLLSLT